MKAETIRIKCETDGFEEATEEVETLAKAYDSFPSQVQIRNCHDCTINIYPSQTKYVEVKSEMPELKNIGEAFQDFCDKTDIGWK